MITLPDVDVLKRHVRDALDAVANRHTYERLSDAEWFPEIASEMASRVKSLNLKCYARGGRRSEPARGCVGSEWLFDFCALLDDEDVPPDDRFMAQAAIIGEVEWSENGIEEDFEKLQIVDSLVCFMAFQKRSSDGAVAAITRLRHAVERRQAYARERGITRPTEFVLSCWVIPENRFVHWPAN